MDESRWSCLFGKQMVVIEQKSMGSTPINSNKFLDGLSLTLDFQFDVWRRQFEKDNDSYRRGM